MDTYPEYKVGQKVIWTQTGDKGTVVEVEFGNKGALGAVQVLWFKSADKNQLSWIKNMFLKPESGMPWNHMQLWSDVDNKKMLAMHNCGRPLEYIAATLHRLPNVIACQLEREGYSEFNGSIKHKLYTHFWVKHDVARWQKIDFNSSPYQDQKQKLEL